MFNFFKKKPTHPQVTFTISGMHCTNCSLTIDDELESSPGVIAAATSYAKSVTTVTYDPAITTPSALKKIIESLNYTATQVVNA
jgi:copper chaperone CopZ